MSKKYNFIIIIFFTLNMLGQDPIHKPNQQLHTIEAIDKNPYKYYQLEVQSEAGIFGALLLNNEKIHEFEGLATQVSSNKAQDLIKNGKNTISLEIKSINPNTKKGYFTGCTIFIALHGINERIFASKETQIAIIEWNPEENKSTQSITYTFELNR